MRPARSLRALLAALAGLLRGSWAAPRPAAPPPLSDGDWVWWLGGRYRLRLHEGPSRVRQSDNGHIDLFCPAGVDPAKREAILYEWYRAHLKLMLPQLLDKWQPRLGVRAAAWGVKRMSSRWGSCNVQAKRIWINLELARHSPDCLEYVLVHELAHLLEPSHNARFKALMDAALPDWPRRRAALEAGPPPRRAGRA